jgi:hypothetical protein
MLVDAKTTSWQSSTAGTATVSALGTFQPLRARRGMFHRTAKSAGGWGLNIVLANLDFRRSHAWDPAIDQLDSGIDAAGSRLATGTTSGP